MAKILIEIDLDDAAFDDEPITEAGRILRHLAVLLEEDGFLASSLTLHNIYGKCVGTARHVEG